VGILVVQYSYQQYLVVLFNKISIIYVMCFTVFCLTVEAFVQLLWSNWRYTRITRSTENLRFPVGETCDLCYQSFFITISTVWCLQLQYDMVL